MSGQNKTVKVPCTECGGEPRNHDILKEHETQWCEEDSYDQGGTKYQICQCRGCDRVRFREESWNSYDRDHHTGDYELSVAIYPQVITSNRVPIETGELPTTVARIYGETIVAYNAGALTLAGGGLRAIVEAICIDQSVLGASLQSKIDNLVAKGLLAKPQADLLHEERYIGNAALHEIMPPGKHDVEDGLVIVEGLLNTIYILPVRAERLRNSRAGREGK